MHLPLNEKLTTLFSLNWIFLPLNSTMGLQVIWHRGIGVMKYLRNFYSFNFVAMKEFFDFVATGEFLNYVATQVFFCFERGVAIDMNFSNFKLECFEMWLICPIAFGLKKWSSASSREKHKKIPSYLVVNKLRESSPWC